MAILLSALLVVGVFIANTGAASAQGGERHSGSVASVDPAARTLVLRELVEEGRPRRLDVRVPASAAVVLSERIPDEQVTRFDAVFAERRIDLGDVRPGDFIVVVGAVRGGATTASAVIVTLRAGSAQTPPAASPPAPSRP